MKVSLNHLRFYQQMYNWSADPAPAGIDKLVEKIGGQLGAVEETIPVGKKYEGVIIVKVVGCEPHPNADRLHVCTLDDGGVAADVSRDGNGLVQVVCGAPNVSSGQTVAWLPPGSTVPSTYEAQPFVLEARELRGVVSNGMLASPKELALGDNHDGILVIDEDVTPGTLFADKYGLRDDVVIDIENKMFTHRPDCFGVMGVAREIAGIQGQTFTSPDWYRSDAQLSSAGNNQLKVEVRNDIPGLVPRFVVVPIADIAVGSSPVWLQVELSRLGLRTINNIVDLTNYYMLLTGQPLHAYDYDKVVAQEEGADHATMVIRKPIDGEKLVLLNGKEIEPRAEAILIASATGVIGLGGVMGGADTEVDDTTTNIILECANFDMYSIRRTSMAHGIFSDAVTRFNKGQSPLQNMAVLAKTVQDVLRICGGTVAGQSVDDNHLSQEVRERNSIHPDVTVSAEFINKRLGLNLPVEDMAQLLRNVEFIVDSSDGILTVRAPFWRTDIEIPEDVVEEVGRLYGFDKLPLELPVRSIIPAKKDPVLEIKSAVRDKLSRAGANELLTYSFVHGNLLDKAGQDKMLAYKLINALSPDLQYYRLSLTPSLLDKVHANIKAGYDEFALFEIGKIHSKSEVDDDGLPREFGRICLVFAAASKRVDQNYAGAAYYQAKKYLAHLLPDGLYTYMLLTEAKVEGHALITQMLQPYEPNHSALVYKKDRIIGVVGEYKLSVQKALKLPAYTAGFEIFTSFFEKASPMISYVALPRYPQVSQDITLRVAAGTSYQSVYDSARKALAALETGNLYIRLLPLDIYMKETETETESQITLRLEVSSYEKTLTDDEVRRMLDAVAGAAQAELGAQQV